MFRLDYFGLFLYLYKVDFKNSATKYYLGLIWWAMEPLLYVLVFYFVFSQLRGKDGSYIYALLLGIVVWRWIQGSIIVSSRSLVRNKNIISSFNVNLLLFPIVDLAVVATKFLILLSCLLIFFQFKGVLVFHSFGKWVLLLSAAVLLIIFLSFFFCFLVPFIPDVQLILSNSMMLLMFLSGVIVPADLLPIGEYEILSYNPFIYVIVGFKAVLLGIGSFPRVELITIIFLSFLGCAVSGTVLHKANGTITKRSVV